MKNNPDTISDDLARILANALSILGIPTFMLTFWNSLSEARTWRIGLEPWFHTFLILYVVAALVTAAIYANLEAQEQKLAKKTSLVHKLARALLFR